MIADLEVLEWYRYVCERSELIRQGDDFDVQVTAVGFTVLATLEPTGALTPRMNAGGRTTAFREPR